MVGIAIGEGAGIGEYRRREVSAWCGAVWQNIL